MPKNSGTFGLMDRQVADYVKNLREKTLFLPALRCWPGFRTKYVHYDRDERRVGETKQTLRSLFRYAWDGISSFSDVPLQWIAGLGFLISGAAFLWACILAAVRVLQFFGYFETLRVLGFTTNVLAILFMGGVQLLAIGVVGVYISRIFVEVKDRPVYVVRGVSSSDAKDM